MCKVQGCGGVSVDGITSIAVYYVVAQVTIGVSMLKWIGCNGNWRRKDPFLLLFYPTARRRLLTKNNNNNNRNNFRGISAVAA